MNTDLSVTAWQLAALRSARLAGVDVPERMMSQIGDCLAACRERRESSRLVSLQSLGVAERPAHAPRAAAEHRDDGGRRADGIATRRRAGRRPLEAGARHLLANLPSAADSAAAPIGTLANPQRDTYYWYYATQAMFYLGGDYWQAWSSELEPLLVKSQVDDGLLAGSWDPLRPVPDKWSTYGGRLYVTAMNLLSLEMRSRQLPSAGEAAPQLAKRPE